MDYDMQLRQYPHNGNFAYPQCYYVDRNSPLAAAHGSRPDPRGCPLGVRSRANMGGEETPPESAQARRRIAVACARCRKRKIRCSGDPGDGSGCQNCKAAQADIKQCQFHRVGSDEVSKVMTDLNQHAANSLGTVYNGMIPIYSAGNPLYSRPFNSNQFPNISTKPPYRTTWTIPCSEETSPVAENYGLDHNYLPSQNTVANVYNDSYRWNPHSPRPFLNATGTYLDQEAPMTSSCATTGLPYISTAGIRPPTTGEGASPLNMTSLETTLPISLSQRPHRRQMGDVAVPQRQLPFPQPTRGQVTTNAVDQMQTRALPPSHVMNGAPTMSANDVYATGVVDQTSAELVTSSDPKDYATIANINDAMLAYPPNSAAASPTSPRPQLNFSTSTLLNSMPAPATSATYSNFRNYTLPTSSSTETVSLMSRENSQTNLYSFSSDSTSKGGSMGDVGGESTLVSGQSYSPLGHPQPQNAAAFEALRRGSFDTRNGPTHQSSMSSLNRGFS
ncbi:hypothetical protein GQ43DRAFT_98466 [Delitschia confertaspora ATCC 74209]|uniref:Zn(2)-C6 fungal-type domain-containing protein n=1 Tax=Delitschia confertaspora ATCC 74209 TaxID=1513339 RepID=A0A9P4JIA9_9PLEO|nr:hypothetical protein GQ43DRAFT_98466 [Delitschia confertaspora ATCC 74209]